MEKSADAFRTISEVADLLETPAHVLRFWESRFPQIKPVKRAGGRRYYRPSDVALLTGIRRLLHDEGMTIRGVQRILREQGVRHVAGLNEEPSPEEEALEAAMLARLDGDDAPRRTTLEIAAEQAAALEAALEVTQHAVVLPFRQPEPAIIAPVVEEPVVLDIAEPEFALPEPAPEDTAVPDTTLALETLQADVARDAPLVDPSPPAAPLEPTVPPAPKGPSLTLTSVSGASRLASGAQPPAAASPSESDTSDASPEEAPVPLANRLRALPYSALALRQPQARAALARLTSLRNRLANPAPPPRN